MRVSCASTTWPTYCAVVRDLRKSWRSRATLKLVRRRGILLRRRIMRLISPLRLLALTICLLASAAGALQAADSSAGFAGSWVGTYTLVGPGTITFDVSGGRAVVALGVGHA